MAVDGAAGRPPSEDRRRTGRLTLRAVLAVEDAIQALLAEVVRLLGRREVTVLPFVGYGSPKLVHVRARVVLGGSAAREAADGAADARTVLPGPDRGAALADGGRPGGGRPDSAADGGWSSGGGSGGRRGPRPGWARRWRTVRESVAPFLTVELSRARVVVRGPAGAALTVADRQGYVDAAVDAGGWAPGWHEVTVAASWRGSRTSVPVPVLVVDPAAAVGVVSDLDDTVIETGLTRGLEFLRLTLFTSVSERTPLPAAAELYRALAARRDGGAQRPVFYLSTSPWNLYGVLSQFIALRGFPPGPLLLTDWGPSRTNLLRLSADRHKLTLIRALLAEHPRLGVVLIGDTGQRDPEIYAAAALEAPGRVLAVYVRRTPGITITRAAEVGALVRRVGAVGVPMLLVEDSVQIARHAAGLGLLDGTDVEAVRRASPG